MLRLLLLTVFLCSVAIGQEPLVAFDGVLQPQPQQAPVLKIPKIQQLNWTAFWPNGEDRAKCPKKEVLEAAGKRLTSGWCLLDAEPILPHPTELAKLVDGVVEAAPKDCKIGVYIGWGYDRGRNGNLKIALDNFGPLVATAEALNGTKAYFISPDIYSYDDSSPENFASRMSDRLRVLKMVYKKPMVVCVRPDKDSTGEVLPLEYSIIQRDLAATYGMGYITWNYRAPGGGVLASGPWEAVLGYPYTR